MIDHWLDVLSTMIGQNMWLAPLLALPAGVLTSVTPCALSNVPLVIGYVGGTGQKNTKKAFPLSITFAAGTAVTFTALGVIASAAGKLMGTSVGFVQKLNESRKYGVFSKILKGISGAVMVAIALYMFYFGF